MNKKTQARFNKFARALRLWSDDRAELLANGAVIIARNEFTPERRFRDTQDAIDRFAHVLGTNL